MRFIDRLNRLLANNAIERQLYPAPSIAFKFRRYRPTDRATVLQIHDAHAAARFPANARRMFEEFLDSNCESFFLAETPTGEVIGCCGVMSIGDFVHTLCFGLVAAPYMGHRIGCTMALARMVFATRVAGVHFAMIHAVPASIGFYQRFGFSEFGTWADEPNKKFPSGVLCYQSGVMQRIERTLKRRGHLIDRSWPLHRDASKEAIITAIGPGRYKVETKLVQPASSLTTGDADSAKQRRNE